MPTENHGYKTPVQGAKDWDVPLNENTNQLDRDIEIRDTDANKSDYIPKEGAFFRATDTGAIYHGDGTNWIKSNIDVNNASAKRLSNIHFVEKYGSVQEAIDAADLGNTVVVDGPVTENDITIDKSLTITGSGHGTIDNQAVDGTTKTIVVKSPRVRIQNLNFKNSSLDAAEDNRCGFHIYIESSANGVQVERCNSHGGVGPIKGYGSGIQVKNNHFENFTEHMTVSTNSRNWVIANNEFLGDPSNPSQRGVYFLENSNGHEFRGNVIKNAEHRGIFINRGASRIRILNNRIENITLYHGIGIENDSNLDGNQVMNEIIHNSIINASSRGIVVEGSSDYDSIDTVVKGNSIWNKEVGAVAGITDNGINTVIENNTIRGEYARGLITPQ